MKNLKSLLAKYLEYLRVKNYSRWTLQNKRIRLGYFLKWCESQDIYDTQEATRDLLESYQEYIHAYRKDDGNGLSPNSQWSYLVVLRSFFLWLSKNNHILYNPSSGFDLPKLRQYLPQNVLTVDEVEKIMAQADKETPLGIRDRAIMETLYSTGIRRHELINLCIRDLDFERGVIFIREGKDRKDRVVPIGDRALDWIRKYLSESRRFFVKKISKDELFLSNRGKRICESLVSHKLHEYIKSSQVEKQGSCHIFRHTMATLMLENGADIRYIQEMLGHEKISSTQVYTRVSIHKLKEVHSLTHPAREPEDKERFEKKKGIS